MSNHCQVYEGKTYLLLEKQYGYVNLLTDAEQIDKTKNSYYSVQRSLKYHNLFIKLNSKVTGTIYLEVL